MSGCVKGVKARHFADLNAYIRSVLQSVCQDRRFEKGTLALSLELLYGLRMSVRSWQTTSQHRAEGGQSSVLLICLYSNAIPSDLDFADALWYSKYSK